MIHDCNYLNHWDLYTIIIKDYANKNPTGREHRTRPLVRKPLPSYKPPIVLIPRISKLVGRKRFRRRLNCINKRNQLPTF